MKLTLSQWWFWSQRWFWSQLLDAVVFGLTCKVWLLPQWSTLYVCNICLSVVQQWFWPPQIEKRLEPVEEGEGNESETPKSGCTIFLGYTSNLISSGVRESIRYLAQHKMVQNDTSYVTIHISSKSVTRFLRICSSASGGCYCNHSRRRGGGFDQVPGSHLPGRLQPPWQGAPPERHQQVC